MHGQQNIKICG